MARRFPFAPVITILVGCGCGGAPAAESLWPDPPASIDCTGFTDMAFAHRDVPVTPGRRIDGHFTARVTGGAQGAIVVEFYGADSEGPDADDRGTSSSSPVPWGTGWTTFTVEGRPAPAGAVTARIFVIAECSRGAGALELRDVEFTREGR